MKTTKEPEQNPSNEPIEPIVNPDEQNDDNNKDLEDKDKNPNPSPDTDDNNDDDKNKEDLEDKEKQSDAVKNAMDLNKKLKEELEALKSKNNNVFEENEILKKELEDQQKLVEMATENANIKQQLEGIKRNAIIEGLIATGKINTDLREWAEDLSFEQLEKFNAHAPKIKTILDEKNYVETVDEDLQEWHDKVSKSRIIS